MKNPLPLVTPELIDKVAISVNDFSRAEEISKLANNPYGVSIREFGKAKAVLFKKGAFKSKSRVSGDFEDTIKYLPEILSFYRDLGVDCRLTMMSHLSDRTVVEKLFDHGLRPISNGVTLIGVPSHTFISRDTNIEVEEWGMERVDDYIELFLEADGVSEENKNDIRDLEKCEYKEPGLRLFVAFVDSTLAAAGSMVIDGMIGRLKSSASLPTFRRKGCQTALLRARFEAAKNCNCELMTVGTALHSDSHRNMERFGMKILTLSTIWKDMPA
jgi:GNAT superfamily N-acetyltransferase